MFDDGMTRPLPFAPDAAYAYSSALKEKGDADAWKAAVAAFSGYQGYGDGHDPWFRLAFRGGDMLAARDDALGSEFVTLAQRVFDGGAA
jgi:hypothetical protein